MDRDGHSAALGGEGLRGQSAGRTALCTVGKSGTGLTYRGYDITDLAHHAEFEEVAYLLLKGKLRPAPNWRGTKLP
ncbi:2-methylcitrate synthase [Photobacterium aphoticum]|uniref:2-methylcitrate synthase n=1 Tax=Photobacterium aphoticum TaxID=754436 RepID=A0A090QT82_9GAMM|nr:2-methylcitrate synthase [Photobacterium aphoticum]